MRETEWIRRYIVPLVSAPGAAHLTDDVAQLCHTGAVTIVTADMLVEDRHFLASDPLHTVGQKIIRVSVSDVFAKGALPKEGVLSLAWPSSKTESDFSAFMSGIGEALRLFHIDLIGGDLVSTDGPLVANLTLTGSTAGTSYPLRSGAKPGDAVWVSGEIGFGGVGLRDAQAGVGSLAAERYRVPQLASLQQVASVAEHATASMDISDGLLLDANRMANASDVAIHIALDLVPLADPREDLAEILFQCRAGDDYQVLLTAPDMVKLPEFTKIGHVSDGEGLQLSWKGQPVSVPERLGYLHGADPQP